MKRQVSSSLTLFFKVIFPALVVFGFGSIILLTIWRGDFEPGSLFIVAVYMIVSVCIVGFSSRFKVVSVDANYLYVSNYLKEIKVPISDVAEVEESYLVHPKHVTLKLKSESAFGKDIVFIPEGNVLQMLGDSPVSQELAEIVKNRSER